MQDFRCYNETLKAIKIGLPGSPRDKQKTPRAHNPKAGPVFHKKSQQGRVKWIFSLPNVHLWSASPCSVPLAAWQGIFLIYIRRQRLSFENESNRSGRRRTSDVRRELDAQVWLMPCNFWFLSTDKSITENGARIACSQRRDSYFYIVILWSIWDRYIRMR